MRAALLFLAALLVVGCSSAPPAKAANLTHCQLVSRREVAEHVGVDPEVCAGSSDGSMSLWTLGRDNLIMRMSQYGSTTAAMAEFRAKGFTGSGAPQVRQERSPQGISTNMSGDSGRAVLEWFSYTQPADEASVDVAAVRSLGQLLLERESTQSRHSQASSYSLGGDSGRDSVACRALAGAFENELGGGPGRLVPSGDPGEIDLSTAQEFREGFERCRADNAVVWADVNLRQFRSPAAARSYFETALHGGRAEELNGGGLAADALSLRGVAFVAMKGSSVVYLHGFAHEPMGIVLPNYSIPADKGRAWVSSLLVRVLARLS